MKNNWSPTNGRTDGPTHPLIEMRGRIEKRFAFPIPFLPQGGDLINPLVKCQMSLWMCISYSFHIICESALSYFVRFAARESISARRSSAPPADLCNVSLLRQLPHQQLV